MNRFVAAASIGLLSMVAHFGGCRADVVTDWDAKATEVASPAALGEREAAIVNLAMFDAVNSVERRYKPYLLEMRATDPVSADAAAASAAATALALLHPQAANDFKYPHPQPRSRPALDSVRPLHKRWSRVAPWTVRRASIPTGPRPSPDSISPRLP